MQKDLTNKLNKVSALIASDAEKITKQEKIIQSQEIIIKQQRDVIIKVRNELN